MNNNAFDNWLKANSERIYEICTSYLENQNVANSQQAFWRVISRFHKLSKNDPSVFQWEDKTMKGWICRACYRAAISIGIRRAAIVAFDQGILEDILVSDRNPEANDIFVRMMLCQAFNLLSDIDRATILSHLENKGKSGTGTKFVKAVRRWKSLAEGLLGDNYTTTQLLETCSDLRRFAQAA